MRLFHARHVGHDGAMAEGELSSKSVSGLTIQSLNAVRIHGTKLDVFKDVELVHVVDSRRPTHFKIFVANPLPGCNVVHATAGFPTLELAAVRIYGGHSAADVFNILIARQLWL